MQEKIIKNRSHWENWIPARSPAGVTPAVIPSCHTVSSSLHHHPLHAAIFCHCHAVLWGVMFRHKEGWGRDLNALDFNCRKSPKVGISKRISPKTACHRMSQNATGRLQPYCAKRGLAGNAGDTMQREGTPQPAPVTIMDKVWLLAPCCHSRALPASSTHTHRSEDIFVPATQCATSYLQNMVFKNTNPSETPFLCDADRLQMTKNLWWLELWFLFQHEAALSRDCKTPENTEGTHWAQMLTFAACISCFCALRFISRKAISAKAPALGEPLRLPASPTILFISFSYSVLAKPTVQTA